MAKVLDLTGLQYFYGKLKTVFALKGEVGVKGEKGDPGTPGKAATIRVGTVTSGAAPAVTNAGSESAAVFNFTLQKGDKGEQGVQGAPGKAGTPGTAATITVGTVTSGTTAKVTNRGNANAAILDFVLPKGEKGDTGSAANVESITNGEIDAFVK